MKTIKIDDHTSIEYDQDQIEFIVQGTGIISANLDSGETNMGLLKAVSRRARIDELRHIILNGHGFAMRLAGVSVPIDTAKVERELLQIARELMAIEQLVIIPIGGTGERWGGYLGVKKQDIEIDGETLLDRIKRQVHAAGFDEIVASAERNRGDASKYIGSLNYWNKKGRTLFLLGDVYYTDAAMHKILFDDTRDWRMFGRAMPNARKDHPEPFAFSFYPGHHEQVEAAAERVIKLFEGGKTDGAGFLFLYRALVGLPDKLMGAHLYGENWIDINDLTDDFDNPNDYHSFMEAKNHV